VVDDALKGRQINAVLSRESAPCNATMQPIVPQSDKNKGEI